MQYCSMPEEEERGGSQHRRRKWPWRGAVPLPFPCLQLKKADWKAAGENHQTPARPTCLDMYQSYTCSCISHTRVW
jgi:hypothetical protein